MMKVGQSNKCGCGRSLHPEKLCDSSHALTEEQYQQMLERVNKKALDDYRKQAMDVWFGDGSCTGGKAE